MRRWWRGMHLIHPHLLVDYRMQILPHESARRTRACSQTVCLAMFARVIRVHRQAVIGCDAESMSAAGSISGHDESPSASRPGGGSQASSYSGLGISLPARPVQQPALT